MILNYYEYVYSKEICMKYLNFLAGIQNKLTKSIRHNLRICFKVEYLPNTKWLYYIYIDYLINNDINSKKNYCDIL